MFKNIVSVVQNGCRSNILIPELTSYQSTRNTFILKRRWPPGLNKKNDKPRPFRGRHYVYDLVEDTAIHKKPNLDLVLTAFVDGVGDKGDVVSVKRNFGYNKLLLPGLAVYKSAETVEKYAKTETEKEVLTHSSPYAQRTVNMLELLTLAVVMNKDNPWVLEPWHIRASLRKLGIHAPDSAIELPKAPIAGPDLSKQNHEFFVTITVNNVEKAQVKCRIHHWSTNPSERLPYVIDHWKLSSESWFETEMTESNTSTNDKKQ